MPTMEKETYDTENLQEELLAEFSNYNYSEHKVTEKSRHIGGFILISFIWIQAFRCDSNVLYVPEQQQMYCVNGFNKTLNALRFRCYCDGCNVKIYVRKDGTAIQKPDELHNHESMHHKYRETQCFADMKKLCLSAPPSTTPKEIYDQAILAYVYYFTEFEEGGSI